MQCLHGPRLAFLALPVQLATCMGGTILVGRCATDKNQALAMPRTSHDAPTDEKTPQNNNNAHAIFHNDSNNNKQNASQLELCNNTLVVPDIAGSPGLLSGSQRKPPAAAAGEFSQYTE